MKHIGRSFIAVTHDSLECSNVARCRYSKMKHHEQPFVLINLLLSIKKLNIINKVSEISYNNNDDDVEMEDNNNNDNHNNNNNNNNHNNKNHIYEAFLKILICLKHSEWIATTKLSNKAKKSIKFWNENNSEIPEFSLNKSQLLEKYAQFLHQIIIEKNDSNLR